MKELLKAQTVAIIATVVDYVLSFVLKDYFHIWYLAASVIGITTGGIVSFVLGRNWTFHSKENAIEGQAVKFIVVWFGSLLLNAGGLYLLTGLFGVKYWKISKIAVSIIIGIGYNYVLQKFFVFKKDKQQFAKA